MLVYNYYYFHYHYYYRTLLLLLHDRRVYCFDLVTPGEYNLKLNPVTLDDDGVYQCQVGTGKRDEPAIRSRKAMLTVLVPPNRPRIVQGDKIYTTENSPIELECISEGGKPQAEVSAEAFHILFITY